MSVDSKKKLNPLTAAIGVAVVSSTFSLSVLAAENPFQAQDLQSGYQLASGDHHEAGEEKSGEMKKDDKNMEGKCGEEHKKDAEGKCGEKKKEMKEKMKEGEGKCGEGKCGEKKAEG